MKTPKVIPVEPLKVTSAANTFSLISDVPSSPPGPPNSIDVLGKIFKVQRMAEDQEPDSDGMMLLSSQEIWFRDHKALSYNQDTVLHETIHSVDEILRLGLKEKQVHQLAVGLLAVIKHNPGFINWLLLEAE